MFETKVNYNSSYTEAILWMSRQAGHSLDD